MALRDYLEILWRRRLVLLLPVLAAAALATAPALLQAPAYRSTATLFFAPRDPSLGTALAGQRLASYVELVGGPRLAQGVAQQLGLPQDKASLDDLGHRLTAAAQPESLLVAVRATAASPQESQRLAQTAAGQLVQLAASLEPPATATQTSPVWLTIAEPAEPGVPLGRSGLVQDVVLALVLGLAVGSALAFLAEALDPRIADARGLRRIVPGPVLPLTIPKAAAPDGVSVGEEPVAPPGALRVLRTALLGHAVRDAEHGAGVLVVTGTSTDRATGSATGTVASWIATALNRSGRTVLLLRAGAPDAGHDGAAAADALDALPLLGPDGGPRVLSLGGEGDDPGEVLAAPGTSELVRQLSERFDHVVVEAPPVLPYVETALLAAQCAHQVVLVVRPGWARRRQVRSAVAVLAQQDAPLTLGVLARALRRSARRGADAEVPAVPASEPPAPDMAPPVEAPLAGDAVAEEEDVVDGELDSELDGELEDELGEDRPVLSGGGAGRGGDA